MQNEIKCQLHNFASETSHVLAEKLCEYVIACNPEFTFFLQFDETDWALLKQYPLFSFILPGTEIVIREKSQRNLWMEGVLRL